MMRDASKAELDEGELQRLRRIARLMDSNFSVPGTKIRFGWDSIVGLIPVVGDVATTLSLLYFLKVAWQRELGSVVMAKLILNHLIDLAVGSVPLLGDLIDVGFKANLRNLSILEKELGKASATEKR